VLDLKGLRFTAWHVAQCLGLQPTRDGYLGTCPLCHYSKPTFTAADKNGRLVVYCFACHNGEKLFEFIHNLLGSANSDNRANSVGDRFLANAKTLPIGSKPLPKGLNRTKREIFKRKQAYKRYKETIPASGTVAEVYFRERGFGNASQPLKIPNAIRFHPSLWYSFTEQYPAIVAAITDWQGHFLAIHRTYLPPDGKEKAPVTIPKKIYGPSQGGTVHLAPAGECLGLAEGIETAWAAMILSGDPVWACLSTGGLESVVLPLLPQAKIIRIYADNDTNHAGLNSARRAEKRFLLEGRRVEIIIPAQQGCDFADVLQQERIKYGFN
jgi:putative DNA primase/helicase